MGKCQVAFMTKRVCVLHIMSPCVQREPSKIHFYIVVQSKMWSGMHGQWLSRLHLFDTEEVHVWGPTAWWNHSLCHQHNLWSNLTRPTCGYQAIDHPTKNHYGCCLQSVFIYKFTMTKLVPTSVITWSKASGMRLVFIMCSPVSEWLSILVVSSTFLMKNNSLYGALTPQLYWSLLSSSLS